MKAGSNLPFHQAYTFPATVRPEISMDRDLRSVVDMARGFWLAAWLVLAAMWAEAELMLEADVWMSGLPLGCDSEELLYP